MSTPTQSQTLSGIPYIGNHSSSDTAFVITAPTASSGLPVTVSAGSANTRVVSVGNNQYWVSFAATQAQPNWGSGNIQFSQAGNATYQPVSASCVWTWGYPAQAGETAQSIAAPSFPSSLTADQLPYTFTAPVSTSNLPVTVSIGQSSDPKITLTGSAGSNQWTIGYKNPNGPTGIATPLVSFALQFDQPGNFGNLSNGWATTYSPTESWYQISVTRANQTLTNIPVITTKSTSDSPFLVTAPTSSSGLPVTIHSGGANTTVTATANAGVYSVTLNSTGSGNIQYTQAGNDTYNPVNGSTTFTITQGKKSQTIGALAAIPNQIYGGAVISETVPAATSGMPVTLSIKSGPATINGNKITTTGVGTVVIAADQAGNTAYTAAPQVTTSFTVTQSAQTISGFTAVPSSWNTSSGVFSVNIPVATSGLPVTLSIKSGPANISGNVITPTGAGTVVIAADQAGNANYSAASEITTSVQVVSLTAQTINGIQSFPAQTYSTGLVLSGALPKASSGLPVTVTVQSGPGVITQTANGLSLAVSGAGTIVLVANQAGNATYSKAPQVTSSIVINKGNQIITKTAFPASGIRVNSQIDLSNYFSNSSGQPLAYTITAPATSYSLSGSKLTVKSSSNNYIIQASQAGSANFNAATSISQTLTAVNNFAYNVVLNITLGHVTSPTTVDISTGVSVWPTGSKPNFGNSWSVAGVILQSNQPISSSSTGRSTSYLLWPVGASSQYAALQPNGTLNYWNQVNGPFAHPFALSSSLGNLGQISAVDQSTGDVYTFITTINFS